MLAEHTQANLPAIDGTPKQQPQRQKSDDHTASVLNGGDTIITISTTTLQECERPSEGHIPVKSTQQADQQPHYISSGTLVHFLKSHSATQQQQQQQQQHPPQQQQQQHHANANVLSFTDSTSSYAFCHLSQFISFQDNIADVHHRKGRRLNGLQLPLHPLQIFGWLVLVLFGIASYCVLIPSFAVELQGPLYGLISGLYIVHVISHLTALLTDPADRELRRVHRNDRIVPEFDRSKHTHVIENGRCHLCNIRTSSPRTKHCSVCNKCVGKFDHHCKWLNHCIGSRNYVAFLMCVVSAVIATLVIVAAVIAQIVLYHVQPEWLSYYVPPAAAGTGGAPVASSVEAEPEAGTVAFVMGGGIGGKNSTLNGTYELGTNATNFSHLNATNSTAFPLEYDANGTVSTLLENVTTLLIGEGNLNDSKLLLNLSTEANAIASSSSSATGTNSTTVTIAGISVSDTIFLVLIGFLGLLAAITAGLLLHLCFFHIYISFLGLTTYEYIRNHRQAQEAKAKQLLSTLPNNGQPQLQQQQTSYHQTNHNPSKKTNSCGQIYFCSSLRHPNSVDPLDVHYFESNKVGAHNSAEGHSKLHCCADSREYHRTGLKTYYMCSLLEERPPLTSVGAMGGIAHISGNGVDTAANEIDALHSFKTFHCCSTFAAATAQRKVSTAANKAALVNDLEAALSARRGYMQYTEQCTFCTFRIRSPIVSKRSSAASGRSSNLHPHAPPASAAASASATAPNPAASKLSGAEHQRCCMKAISKHQRWRRKWNCCSNVPDSPDVPNDIIAALAMRHQHGASAATVANKKTATDIPVHFIKTVHSNAAAAGGSRPTTPRNANLKVQARTRNARTWPVARLRHMMRMLNRYRRPRCRHNSTASSSSTSAAEQVKQNQIRPLQLLQHNASNGCQLLHQHQHHYYDSSSPQPPSSTTTASERSDQSPYSDSTNSSTSQPHRGAIETILPTSVIRADTSVTYTTPIGITLPPALPPPTRRKIPNPTDLEELAETLSFASHPSNGSLVLSPAQRMPAALNNVYRRQRRKHFLRTRSPTLSPIHESGLSNPTSPQPCRHNAAAPANCSPSNAASGALSEPVRKTSSNSSLHSISSNSSSN